MCRELCFFFQLLHHRENPRHAVEPEKNVAVVLDHVQRLPAEKTEPRVVLEVVFLAVEEHLNEQQNHQVHDEDHGQFQNRGESGGHLVFEGDRKRTAGEDQDQAQLHKFDRG